MLADTDLSRRVLSFLKLSDLLKLRVNQAKVRGLSRSLDGNIKEVIETKTGVEFDEFMSKMKTFSNGVRHIVLDEIHPYGYVVQVPTYDSI